MSDDASKAAHSLARRIDAEFDDSFDEELEMELDDDRLSRLLTGEDGAAPASVDRHLYFRELFRLQSELVKLQDWVVAQ